MTPTKEFTYIDLFAGCGGLSLGLHNAGWKGLFAIEKSKDAFETLEFNLIKNKNHFTWPKWLDQKEHDINKVIKNHRAELVKLRGKVDMVTGGPPCQGFSTAGQRKEADIRNTLIDSYINFIKLVKPKILFFENVKGFTMEFDKNKEKGQRYSDYVIAKLNKAGYNVHPELINFAEYGVPQKRCRFILVGVRKDVSRKLGIQAADFFRKIADNKQKFLVSKGLQLSVSLEDAISDLLKKNGTMRISESNKFEMGKYAPPQSKYQLYIRAGASGAPDSHRYANHSAAIESRFAILLKLAPRGKDIGDEIRQKFGIKKRTVVPLDGTDQAPTLCTLPDDYIHYAEPRILTVREYARIQSFPDSYKFKGKYTTGGKQRKLEVPRYTQIGNAIPPLFGEQSGIVLKKIINGG